MADYARHFLSEYVRQHTLTSTLPPPDYRQLFPKQDLASFVLDKMLEHDDGNRILLEMANDASDRLTGSQWAFEALRLRRALVNGCADTTQVTMLASGNSCFFGVALHAAVSVGRFSALVVDQDTPAWSNQLNVVKPRVVFVERQHCKRLLEALDSSELTEKPRIVLAPTRFLSEDARFEPVADEEGIIGYDKFVCNVPTDFDLREEVRAIKREIDPFGEVAILPFTSGTTSPSKAYCYTHAEAMFWPVTMKMPPPVMGGVVMKTPIVTPMCHMMSMSACMLYPVWGCTAHVQRVPPTDERSCLEIAKSIEKHHYFFLAITPWSLRVIARHAAATGEHFDMASLFMVMTAGSALPPYERRRLAHLFPSANAVRSFYGTTELGSVVADQGTSGLEAKDLYANGRLTASRKLIVASIDAPLRPDGRRALLSAGGRGELLVNEQLPLTHGIRYLDNDEGTRRLRSEYQGFYNTGDFGYYKENGAVYIEDRCQDMIRVRSPTEPNKTLYVASALIEAIIVAFNVAIVDAGIRRRPQGDNSSDIVDALVVVESDANIDSDELLRFLRKELESLPEEELERGVADALVIRHVKVVHTTDSADDGAAIKRNILGKLVRRHLMRDEAMTRI